jgi:hypothetical protein
MALVEWDDGCHQCLVKTQIFRWCFNEIIIQERDQE